VAHTHYKGTGQIHSFRGLLPDGEQQKIRIAGSVGAIAWRITKLEMFPNLPGTEASESTIQIWREVQDSVSVDTATVDFSNDELLAASFLGVGSNAKEMSAVVTIFDNALFVRNIYATHTNTDGTGTCNYYIELEEVKVSAAGMAQLAVAAARRLGLNP